MFGSRIEGVVMEGESAGTGWVFWVDGKVS